MSERTPLTPAAGLTASRIQAPPPRPVPEATPAESSPVPAPVTPKAKTPKQRPAASSKSSGGGRVTSLTLPLELHQRLRAHTVGSGLNHSETILAAIESQHAQLPALVAAAQATTPPQGGGLFPDPTVPRPSGPARTTAHLRTTAANLAVIDALVASTGAASRSQLIATALKAYLQT